MHQFIGASGREGGSAETSAATPRRGATSAGFGENPSARPFEEYTNVLDVTYDSPTASKDWHRTVFGDRATDPSHAPHDGGSR